MNGWGRAKTLLIVACACAVGIAVGALSRGAFGDKTESRPTAVAEKPRAGEHEGHGHKSEIVLTPEQKKALGLKIAPAPAQGADEVMAVTGKIAAVPEKTVVVSPRAPGRLVRVMAELGARVGAGETLALLDSMEGAELLADISQSEASLKLAETREEKERDIYEAKLCVLETARRQGSAVEAERELSSVELGRPKQEFLAALARLELARANFERQQLLVEKRIGARKELIEAEKSLIMARGEADAVGETIRMTARQDLLAAETATRQARLQRDKLVEKLRLLGVEGTPTQKNLLLPLKAPFSGTVIERQAVEGQVVERGSSVFRLADIGTVIALIDVPETVAGRLRTGQEVFFEEGPDGPKAGTGPIKLIGDVIDEQTRTVKVRVELANPGRRLRPGMFVTARISVGKGSSPQIILPPSAVLLMDEKWVAFVEEGDELEARPVEPGPKTPQGIVIRSGIKQGDKVVMEGAFALKAHILKSKMGESESGHVH